MSSTRRARAHATAGDKHGPDHSDHLTDHAGAPVDAASIMAGHEQIAVEIDMHAEMLTALGQRLDLVLHRVGQRRQLD